MQKCFYYELVKRESIYKTKEVPIIYQTLQIDDGLRLDLLIEDLIIIELKAQENYHPGLGSPIVELLKTDK